MNVYEELTLMNPLPSEENNELAIKAKTDHDALEKLLQHNIKLILKSVRQYPVPFMDFEDIVDEGIVGLLTAVQNYDPNFGTCFTTVAAAYIKNQILHTARTNQLIVYPPSFVTALSKYTKIMEQINNEKITDKNKIKKIFKENNLSEADVKNVLARKRDLCISLDDSENVNMSMPADNLSVEETVEDAFDSELLYKAIDQLLTAREKYVIENAFGLHGKRKLTCDEIGMRLDLTKQRIQQIRIRALQKLGTCSARNPLIKTSYAFG